MKTLKYELLLCKIIGGVEPNGIFSQMNKSNIVIIITYPDKIYILFVLVFMHIRMRITYNTFEISTFTITKSVFWKKYNDKSNRFFDSFII